MLLEQNANAAEKLMGYAESMGTFLRQNGFSTTKFGKEAIKVASRDSIKKLVKNYANQAFANDMKATGEAAGAGNAYAVNAKIKANVSEKIKQEYIARAEHALLDTQTSGGVMTDITTHQQLYMVALLQGTIQPTYSKIFKTVVDPNPVYVRQINVPKLIDHNGKAHILADVLNDNKLINELTESVVSDTTFELSFASKEINANIIDQFNAAVGSGKIKATEKNFLNRGFKIKSIIYDNSGTDIEIPVDYTATEIHTQSGEISDTVGVVNIRLQPNPKYTGAPTTDINIFGPVQMDGTVKLSTNDAKVKKIKITFNLPPVGMQNPYTVQHVISKYQETINKHTKATCQLNEMFLQDHVFYLGKEAVELFNESVFQITNAKKDAYALEEVEKLIADIKESKPMYQNLDNYFNGPTRQLYAEKTIRMNETNNMFIDALNANNMQLSITMFDLMNDIDLAINPRERNFTIYSASRAAKWMKDAYGNMQAKFNLVGNAGNEVAGIFTPYDLSRITVGDLYSANYIASNRIKAENVTIDGGTAGLGLVPANMKSDVEQYDYTVITAFEDDKDSLLFISGKEFLTEGTGTSEDPASPSLNYQHRYQMIKMNKVIGRLHFQELPQSLHN